MKLSSMIPCTCMLPLDFSDMGLESKIAAFDKFLCRMKNVFVKSNILKVDCKFAVCHKDVDSVDHHLPLRNVGLFIRFAENDKISIKYVSGLITFRYRIVLNKPKNTDSQGLKNFVMDFFLQHELMFHSLISATETIDYNYSFILRSLIIRKCSWLPRSYKCDLSQYRMNELSAIHQIVGEFAESM